VAAAFALTIVAGLVVRATPPLRALDVGLYHAVNGLACGATDADPVYHAIWTALNRPALNYYVLYGITFAYVLLRRREQWLRLLVVTALIAGLGSISNPISWHWAWGPRPFTVTSACIAHPEWEAIWSQYSSFPSGHARETAAELTAMVAFWPAALLPAAAYMALLAFSRLYLGVHFPSDVLIGAVFGWAIARTAFLTWDVAFREWWDRRSAGDEGAGTSGGAARRDGPGRRFGLRRRPVPGGVERLEGRLPGEEDPALGEPEVAEARLAREGPDRPGVLAADGRPAGGDDPGEPGVGSKPLPVRHPAL
jgi:membrane-associated phospholipid phosphatase